MKSPKTIERAKTTAHRKIEYREVVVKQEVEIVAITIDPNVLWSVRSALNFMLTQHRAGVTPYGLTDEGADRIKDFLNGTAGAS